MNYIHIVLDKVLPLIQVQKLWWPLPLIALDLQCELQLQIRS